MKRLISKTPEPPKHISPEMRTLLTKLCFGDNVLPERCDLLFVYGTAIFFDEISSHVSDILRQNITDKVLIVGGIVPDKEALGQKQSEARLVYDTLDHSEFAKIDFFLEETSHNTLENVRNGLKVLDFRDYQRICFVFPAHGAGRGYLTLKKFAPNSQIFQSAYDVLYPGDKDIISKDTWHTFDLGIKRVWGEFLRIREYGRRGDIAYDEVQELIAQIDKMTDVKA
jgi:hypothetical protein